MPRPCTSGHSEGTRRRGDRNTYRRFDTVNNLGALYKDQGRLSDAEAMYEQALRGVREGGGPEHQAVVRYSQQSGDSLC